MAGLSRYSDGPLLWLLIDTRRPLRLTLQVLMAQWEGLYTYYNGRTLPLPQFGQ